MIDKTPKTLSAALYELEESLHNLKENMIDLLVYKTPLKYLFKVVFPKKKYKITQIVESLPEGWGSRLEIRLTLFNFYGDPVATLHYLAKYNRPETVRIALKEYDFDIHAKNNDGETALDIAAKHDRGDIVKIFKENTNPKTTKKRRKHARQSPHQKARSKPTRISRPPTRPLAIIL